MSAKRDEWFKKKVTMITGQGYRAIPVYKDGSTPGYAKGQTHDADSARWANASHIGVVLDDAVLLDYDGNKTDDIISLDDLAYVLGIEREELDAALVQHNKEGNSLHYLFDRGCDLEGLKQSNDGKWREHIDIKTGNQLMHVKPGKVIVGGELPDASWELCECPAPLIEALKSNRVAVVDQVEDEDADLLEALDARPVEEIRAKLDQIDPDCGYEDWRNVGMALHDWNANAGLALWDEWSAGSTKFESGACAVKWGSFTKGGGVGVGTLYHMAEGAERQAVVFESREKLDGFLSSIKKADETELKTALAQSIQRATLDPLDKEVVAKAVQARLKSLLDVSIPIGMARDLITYKPDGETEYEKPDWCDDWVYVNSHQAMFNVNRRKFYKGEGFNMACGRFVPMSENGAKQSAMKFVGDSGFVELAEGTVYMPGVTDVICSLPMTGDKMVNTFDHRSVPTACGSVSEDGQKSINVIIRHLEVLTGSADDAQILLQWLAFNVQHPGRKLLWSPMIQSIQGVGKSFIGRLLMAALGNMNVGTVSPTQVVSANNGWATGVCVNILEELKIAGHNRYEAANALKPLVTDPYIQITDKWVKAYNTMNTTNYLCFTNHKDAIPLEDNDRRWWVVFCPLMELADIGKPFGLNMGEYLDQLWAAVDEHPGCLRRWLLDVTISQQFEDLKQAPMTIHKQAMIATEKGGVEWFDEIKELIEKGGPLYNNMVVSSADLFSVANLEIEGFALNAREKNLLLKKLGFMQHGNTIYTGGRTRRVWTKRSMTTDEIREFLAEVPF